MNDFSVLPICVEKCINDLIKSKYQEDNLSRVFPNCLLREDVLDLLDRYCTVVYYPIENEDNNGFRVKDIPFANGSCQDFVFINTAQTLEKQAFTAAHELGHIWNVDRLVIQKCEYNFEPEAIINRFAAVLLMPMKEFQRAFLLYWNQYADCKNNSITYINLIRIIVHLMNQFFAPLKAVTLRLVETGFFNTDMIDTLLNGKVIPPDLMTKLVQRIIDEFGYVKLKNPSNKKWIEGLSDKLDIAEREHLISENKIRLMRERFDLTTIPEVSPEMNQSFSINSQEGIDS